MRCRASIVAVLVAGLPLLAQSRVESLHNAASLIDKHELGAAEAALKPLLTNQPNDPLALNLLGVIRLQQQKPDQAELLFHQSIKADPHITGPHINLAMLYGVGRPFDAIDELNEALKLAAGNVQAESLLHQIVKESALEAMHLGDKDKALAILVRAREAAPGDPELLYELGFVALDADLYEDAQKSLEEALRLRPGYQDAMYALARAYLGENMAAQAEDEMRKYLTAKPNDASAHYGLGYILVAEQKLEEARAEFERSLALQPEQTESWFQLGEIAMEQGDEGSARQDLLKVLTRDPHHAGALTELGILAYRSARYDEAKHNLEQAVESAPSYQKAHYYYALTLAKLGDKANADHEFELSKSLQKTHVTNTRLALTQP